MLEECANLVTVISIHFHPIWRNIHGYSNYWYSWDTQPFSGQLSASSVTHFVDNWHGLFQHNDSIYLLSSITLLNFPFFIIWYSTLWILKYRLRGFSQKWTHFETLSHSWYFKPDFLLCLFVKQILLP